jgi:hypothetical protein
MRHELLLVPLICLSAAPAQPQGTERQAVPSSLQPEARPATSAGGAETQVAALDRDGRDGGEGQSALAVHSDDSVPLPIAAVWRETAHGDILESPPSGDPFFLGYFAGSYYPPAGEAIDPQLLASIDASQLALRPNGETYAFAMFYKRMQL